jgi:lipopolysaccharide transport system ATP-binding protein
MVAVSCKDISKSFALIDGGGVWRVALGAWRGLSSFEALKGVSFDVPKGQFVGILGRNGAGKSTLLRVIGGVYPADCGQVAVHGALSGLYELGLVGNAQLTGRQYADRLLTIHGFDRRQRGPMIAEIHDFSELGDRFEDPVQTYSAGMAARLFFSTATAGRYEVYLLDEILSVGDQHFQAKCWRRLRDRVLRGASGILVTHDWSAVVRMCETTHVLDRGRLIFSGPSERAARIYLYGENASPMYRRDLARLGPKPASPIVARQGEDLEIRVEVNVLVEGEARIALVIERMETGYGWETSLMSRHPVTVGSRPGRYQVGMVVPKLPIEPGSYQLSIQLMTPDAEARGQFILLDSYGWLNGNGVTLEVEGDLPEGLCLPTTWSLSQPSEPEGRRQSMHPERGFSDREVPAVTPVALSDGESATRQ